MGMVIHGRIRLCYLSFKYTPTFIICQFLVGANEHNASSASVGSYISYPSYKVAKFHVNSPTLPSTGVLPSFPTLR